MLESLERSLRIGDMTNSAPYEQFAASLRKAMTARGIKTQAALAEELGFKQQAVSKWLHGLARPSLEVVTALEDFLELERGTLGITLGYAYPVVTEASSVSASSSVPAPTVRVDDGVPDGVSFASEVEGWHLLTDEEKADILRSVRRTTRGVLAEREDPRPG